MFAAYLSVSVYLEKMPRADYKKCRNCGRSTAEVGPLSHVRLCPACGGTRFVENLAGMMLMTGPFAQHWRQRMAASVGAVIPERIDATNEER
jgi:RNA polymerase subunit RPABC4/transcription elongation factor Spt4